MNRRNILNNEVANFLFENFCKQLNENPLELFQNMEKFSARNLSVSDTGIDRKLMFL